jgi:hypothetical protein
MDLDPFTPTFKEYQKKIRRAYEDFWKYKNELERYFPAGPNKIWDFDDENMCMRKLKLPDCEWEKFEEPNDELE